MDYNTPWTFKFSLGDNTLECHVDIFYTKYGKDIEATSARFVEAQLFIKGYQLMETHIKEILMEFVIPDNLVLIDEDTGDATNVIVEIERQAIENFQEEFVAERD
tara:strand:+ start:273 stop:587 length:315 start_codon:yes stop_codon:yes gene_type:complete